ncbi:MAG: C-terminal binding protein [Acidimicrobiales bacterium]
MTSFKVVVTDQLASDVDLERELLSAAGGSLEVPQGGRDAVIAAIGEADGILNTYFALDGEVIEGLKRCRIIARYGIGVDNIDLAAATAAAIAVTNVPDYCVEEVATQALSYLLALVRRIKRSDELVRSGGWGVDNLGPIHRASTLTVGLVGYGRIAKRFAELVAPLGCSLLVADPYVSAPAAPAEPVGLAELFERSDVVSLHCPLTEETRALVDAAALDRMKDGAFLINVSRGPLVVLDDLITALASGKLGGAALDTFEQEPPPAEKLAGVPGLLTSPHSAYYSRESVNESRRKAVSQIVKALTTNEPLDYRVN